VLSEKIADFAETRCPLLFFFLAAETEGESNNAKVRNKIVDRKIFFLFILYLP